MMADEECNKKLEDLQKYIPFLKTMISQLQNPNKEREKQLNKMVSLLSMITEKKKLKIDTLNKCEEVILQLLNKVKHKPPSHISSNAVSPPESTSLSPPRDATTSKEIISKPFLKERVYKNDGCFAKKPTVFERLGSKMLSPVKRPVISFQDLSLLQNDVRELYDERRSSYVPKTKMSFHSELAVLKEKIQSKKDVNDKDKVIDKAFTITKSVTTVYEHRRSEVAEEKNYSKSISSSNKTERIRFNRSPSYDSKDKRSWKYENRRSVSLDRDRDDWDKRAWRKERRSDTNTDLKKCSREKNHLRDDRRYDRRSTSIEKIGRGARERRSWSNDRRPERSTSKERNERRKYDRSLSRERNEDKDKRFSKGVWKYRRSNSREKTDKDKLYLKTERRYRRSVSRDRRKQRSVSRERTGDKDKRYTTSERKYEYLEDKEKRYPKSEHFKRERRSDYSPNPNRSHFKKEERRSRSWERYKNEPKKDDRSITYKTDREEKRETKDSRQETVNDANHNDSSNNENTSSLALPDMLKKVDNNSVTAESVYDLILDEVRKEVVPCQQKNSAESASVLGRLYSPTKPNSDMDISTDEEEKATSSLIPVTKQNVPLPFPFPTHSISKVVSYPKSSSSTQVTRVVTNRTLTVVTTTDVFNQFGRSSPTPSPTGGIMSTPSPSQQLLSLESAPQDVLKLISPTPSEPPPILSPQCERPTKLEQESRYLEYQYRPPAQSPVGRDCNDIEPYRECSRFERTLPKEEKRRGSYPDDHSRSPSRDRSRPRSVSPGRYRSRLKVKRLRSMTPDTSSESPDRGEKPSRSTSPEREVDVENRREPTPEASEKKIETSNVDKTVIENENVTKTDVQVENNESRDSVKTNETQESTANNQSREDVEQAAIINNFLKKLLEDERTRAAASTFIENVSDSVDDEELRTVVQAIKSESLEPVIRTKINVRGSNRQKPIIEDEESSVEDEPVIQREKPKTVRHKSELDMLHDDIRSMFIRDGLLTSTGQRMCRLLKNDTTRNTAERFDCKDPTNWKTLKYMQGAYVSIPILTLDSLSNDDSIVSLTESDPSEKDTNDGGRYSLRDIKKGSVNYLEIDSEDEHNRRKRRKLEDDRERYPLRIVSKPVYREESSDDEVKANKVKIGEVERLSTPKSVEKSETATKERNTSASSTPKKINYKRRGKAWASGVIPKLKKKKEKPSEKPRETETASTFIEPDKNYYIRHSMRSHALCKLCNQLVRNVTLHYRMEHPDSEILSSRLSPKIAQEAVRESIRLNLDGTPDEPAPYACRYKCRFCDSSLTGTVVDFRGHISSHTGEFLYECEHCLYATGARKHVYRHYTEKHNVFYTGKVFESKKTKIYGYLCMDCNYVQMNRKAVEDHVNIYHLEEGKKIVKIYLSYFDHLKSAKRIPQRSKPCPLSVKKKMEQEKLERQKMAQEKGGEQQNRDQSPVPKPKRRYFRKSTQSVKRKTEENCEEPVKKKVNVTNSSTIRRVMKEQTSIEYQVKEPATRSEPEKGNAYKELSRRHDTVENMIQKLTDMLGEQTNSAEDRQELLLNLDKEKTVLNSGFLSVVKDVTGLEYTCKLPLCSYKSRERKTFIEHWKSGHLNVNRKYKKTVCQICQSDITVSSDNTLLLKFFEHVEGDHLGLRRKESTSQDNVTDVLNLLKTYLDKTSNNEVSVEIKQEQSSVKTELQGTQEKTIEPSGPQKVKLEATEMKKETVVKPDPSVKKETVKSVAKTPYEWMSFGFLDVLKDETSLEYMCRLPNCSFMTKETLKFLGHWNEDHDIVRNNHKIVTCLGCQTIVTAARNQNVLSLFFEHVKKEHLDKKIEKNVENKPKETVSEVVLIDSESDEEATIEIPVHDPPKKTPEPPKPIKETKETNPIATPSVSSTPKVVDFEYLKVIITRDSITYLCQVDKVNCSMQTVIRERILDHWIQNHPIGEVKCATCFQKLPDLTSLFFHIVREHFNEIAAPAVPEKTCSIPFTFKISEVKSLATPSEPPEDKSATVSSDPIKIKPLSSLTAQKPPQPNTSKAVKIAEVRSLTEDKQTPFKIANVMSLATPPPLRQYPAKPKSPENKSAAALSVFLNNPNMLYKCPRYFCQYCTDDRSAFSSHMSHHCGPRDEIVQCVYCTLKTSLNKNVTHVDLHHSKSRYSCSKCLYRAVLKEYVVVHMQHNHKGDVKVLRLKTGGEKAKTSSRTLSVSQACHAFRCGHADCGSEFLYQSEYYFHLSNFHGGYMICGFKYGENVCQYKCVVADKMMDHWKVHTVYGFHCLRCKAGTTNLYAMLEHYSVAHANSEPVVVDRRVTPRGDRVYGYSADACIGIKYVNDEVLKCVEPGTYTVEDPENPSSTLTIEIESSDDEEAEELSEETLMKKYGKVCPPVGKELKCPLCLEFTTKKPSYFVYHLLVELKCDRFKCNTCNYSCIPLDTMLAHCQDDHNNVITAGLTEIPINKRVEYWIQMVLKYQSKLIIDKDATITGNDSQSQFYNTQCDFCQKWFRSIDLLNEHELCHWAKMTFGCGRCSEVRAPSLDEVFRHSRREHPNEECSVTANAPSLVIPTWKSFPSKAANEKAQAEPSASQTQEVLYGCLQCHVTVANVETLRKHQVECHGGDGKDFRCRILKKSDVELRLMLCLTT